MKLTLLGTDSAGGSSPTAYATDRGTYIAQGWPVTDPEALAFMNIPAHETAVEFPAAMARFFPTEQR